MGEGAGLAVMLTIGDRDLSTASTPVGIGCSPTELTPPSGTWDLCTYGHPLGLGTYVVMAILWDLGPM